MSQLDRGEEESSRKTRKGRDAENDGNGDSGRKRKRGRRRRTSSSPSSGSSSESCSSSSDSDDTSESSGDRRTRRRRKKEREEHERRRRDKKRKLKEEKLKKEKKKRKKEKLERQKQGPVQSWGKYGLIKETDMWSKRPEFSAWLSEVKKVNLETLSNWEERQMFKEYMEDYNTATFPSKKYYNVDKHFHRKLIRKMEKAGYSRPTVERTEFNDEEQRRQEIKRQREHQKEAEVDALKRSMMGNGMAQAMKEQAQLREEMQYQFRLGNVEAANAIQRRLIPDAALPKE